MKARVRQVLASDFLGLVFTWPNSGLMVRLSHAGDGRVEAIALAHELSRAADEIRKAAAELDATAKDNRNVGPV